MQPASIFQKHSVPEDPPLKEGCSGHCKQDGEAGTRSKKGVKMAAVHRAKQMPASAGVPGTVMGSISY